MTRNSRKTLLATTMLAGFAIFTLDIAQAGPNGPSFSGGSISGFSSTRMDFNRLGGPGRALSRNELRVVPIEIVKKPDIPRDEKPKDTKSVAKKDTATKHTKVARVSSPKSGNAGKGKNDVGNGPKLQIDPAIAEIYAVTGGNIGDVSRFDEFADRLGLGPLTVANPLFPNNGDDSFPFPWPKTDQESSDRNFIYGWSGYGGAPGGPDTSKTGWAGIWVQTSTNEGNGWSVSTYRNDETGATGTRRSSWHGDTSRREVVVEGRDSSGNNTRDRTVNERHTDSQGHVIRSRVSESSDIIDNGDGTTTTVTFRTYTVTDNGQEVYRYESNTSTTTDSEGNVVDEKKASQPVAEGSGRPSNNGGGWCSPTGGCYRPARNNGSPRIIPAETDGGGTVSAHRQLPSWATDPNPDRLGGTGGGSGYSGYTPEDEEDGDNGGPGNPALEALNAAL